MPSVHYISYDEELFRDVAESTDLDVLTFAVTFQEKSVPTTTVRPTTPTLLLSIELLVGVAVGVVLAIILLILIVVIVCVFGRRRKQTKK